MTAIEQAKGTSVATPLALVARVEQLIERKVESARPVSGGYTPATRLLCQTAQGRFFVKSLVKGVDQRLLVARNSGLQHDPWIFYA